MLDCADDVFALGSTSNIVAAELASLSWAKTRRKVLNFPEFICHLLLLVFGFHFLHLFFTKRWESYIAINSSWESSLIEPGPDKVGTGICLF